MKRQSFFTSTISRERIGLAVAHFIHQYGLAVILVAFTVLALLYDVNVPFFEKPDELKHFAVIQFIQTRRQLPVVQAGVYKSWIRKARSPRFIICWRQRLHRGWI